jgi:hypothetical protein
MITRIYFYSLNKYFQKEERINFIEIPIVRSSEFRAQIVSVLLQTPDSQITT